MIQDQIECATARILQIREVLSHAWIKKDRVLRSRLQFERFRVQSNHVHVLHYPLPEEPRFKACLAYTSYTRN